MHDEKKKNLWAPAHVLAAELAQWGMDANLLKTAASYMKVYPEMSLDNWLERLVRLGDLFSSSEQTERYRQQLQEACRRVERRFELQSGDEWAWVLGWAARLLPHYQDNLRLAQKRSPVDPFVMQPVEKFRRPQLPEKDTELPAVSEVVSEEAQTIFEQMQQIWATRDNPK